MTTLSTSRPMVGPFASLASLAPAAHAVLRIGAGLLFMQHGFQKHLGFFGGVGPAHDTVPLLSLFGLAGVLELAGGALIALGLWVRPVAIILLIEMISAYFIAHLPKGGFPIENGGELALLYALVFVFLAANGAGPASADARRAR